MRPILVPAVVLAMAVSSAALAQGQQSGSQQSSSQQQQQLETSLRKGGFQSVQMIDSGIIATAQTKEGQQVTLVVNPKGQQSGASSQSQSSSQSGAGGQQASQQHQTQLRESLRQAEFENVQFHDQAKLAQAQTRDGAQVYMVIGSIAASGLSGGSQPDSGSSSQQPRQQQ